MADEVARAFPLFPLGVVALPHELLPLHIFEERYRTMIGECLERGSEFGIVWAADDGRMNILTRGIRPFRLIERQDDLPYPAGVVEFLADEEEDADDEAAAAAHGLYQELVKQATDRTLEDGELDEMDAYRMAATVEFPADAKQELLELRSESARLRLLATLLREALERLELVERAQARARSNGKVRFG